MRKGKEEKKRKETKSARMSMEEPWLFVGGSEETEGILPWA